MIDFIPLRERLLDLRRRALVVLAERSKDEITDTGLIDRLLEHKRLLESKSQFDTGADGLPGGDPDRRRAVVLAAALYETAQARNSYPAGGNSRTAPNRRKPEGRRALLRHPRPKSRG